MRFQRPRENSKDLELVTVWGQNNAITSDQRKSEFQHFTQAKKPNEYSAIILGDLCILPNQVTRWLSLDEPHPLKKRAYGKSITRLTETANTLPRLVDSENITLNSEVFTTTSENNSSRNDIYLFTDGARSLD